MPAAHWQTGTQVAIARAMADQSPVPPLSSAARALGLSGLLPQAAAVVAALSGPEGYWVAIAIGCAYAGIIFSFLGGVWWGIGLRSQTPPPWIYLAAVAPSLIAVAAFLPWVFGYSWPVPSLYALAAAIGLSPLIDQAIARRIALPAGWLALRWQLSLGLGGLTAVLAMVG